MKNNDVLFLGALLLLLVSMPAYGQEMPLGKCSDLLQEVKKQSGTSRRTITQVQLVIPSAVLPGKINFQVSEEGSEYVIGEIVNVPRSSFYLRVSGNTLEGDILLQDSKKAYRYYSDGQGNAFVTEEDINKLICIGLAYVSDKPTAPVRTDAISPALLTLESYPGGKGCVLLDFDGQYVSGTPWWNNGKPINAAPSTLTDAEIQEVWELVSEDFRPFHLNITTSETVFNSYPKNRRMRCIFTPTTTAAPGWGGVSRLGSFIWNDDTPCWVFNTRVRGAGDAASHEVGHTFGLEHDGRTNPVEEQYYGQGSWAPIMGFSGYKAIAQWSKGEYAYANNTEDDLAKIASSINGVGYRPDDYGVTLGSAATLAAGRVSKSGVIGRTGDVDMFTFTTGGGAVSLTFNTAERQANLDIRAKLYNSSGTILVTSNPSGQTASISTTLSEGTYYVAVMGTGAGNPATDGYSNYGSLGLYAITGTIPVARTAITAFTIAGQVGQTVIDTAASTVSVTMPYGTDVTALTPAIGVSVGSTLSPPSGEAIDFTHPFTYTVTTEDHSFSQNWTASVRIASTRADITAFAIAGQVGQTLITTARFVIVTMPVGTDVTALSPGITVSAGATISPKIGVPRDFTQTYVYTVTAEDPAFNQRWTVVVRIVKTAAEITAFTIAGQIGETVIDATARTVSVTMPYGTDVTALRPSISVSPFATINVKSGEPKDFTHPFTYTVTAEDPAFTQHWTAAVRIVNTATSITGFTIPGQLGETVIDPAARSVSVTMPMGTDVTALRPAISVSSFATISPPGDEPKDFTHPFTYTVTAEDPAFDQRWTVTVRTGYITGVQDELPGLRIYPNPAGDVLHIEYTGTVQVQLADLTGRALRAAAGTRLELDLGNLGTGLYLLTVQTAGRVYTRKVIKAQ